VLPDQTVYCPQCGASTKPEMNNPVRIDVKAFVEEVVRTQKTSTISSCLSRSWKLVCSDYWTFFVATLVAIFCISIPILSFIIIGGVYYYYLGKIRSQYRKFEDIFIGFQRQAVQLSLVGLVQTAISLVLCIPLIIIYVINLELGHILVQVFGQEPNVSHLVIIGIINIFMILFMYVSLICLSILWFFSYHLTIDHNLQFWDAMEISRRVVMKRFFSTLLLAIVLTLLSVAGTCCCYVGIFFVAPFIFAAWSYAYEDIFGGVSSENTSQITV
jgi:hypothetical protein